MMTLINIKGDRVLMSLAAKFRLLVFSIVVVTIWGGCTGFHLHNSADEQLAKQAQQSFKAADILGFIESERKALAATNERDVGIVRRNMQAERDALLIFALESATTAQKLIDYLQARRDERGIPVSTTTIQELHDLEQLKQNALNAKTMYEKTALKKGLQKPEFPPSKQDVEGAEYNWGKCAGQDNAGGNLEWCAYEDAAKRYVDASVRANSLTDGELGQLNAAIQHGRKLQSEIIKKTQAAKADLSAAKKKYEAAAQNPLSDLPALETSIKNALVKFDAIESEFSDKVRQYNLRDLLAVIEVERLKSIRGTISDFLAAYQGATASGANNSEAESGASLEKEQKADVAGKIAAIFVRASKDIKEATIHAKLVPLLFEQERLRIEIGYGEKSIERGNKHLSILERERNELIREGVKIVDAINSIKACESFAAADKCTLASDTTFTLLTKASANAYVLHALSVLSESITIHKLKRREADIELVALAQEEALDGSEYALKLWAHMIAIPLEELVAYHSSGLKSEDIANLIHAAGLAGIAVGVNR